DVVLGDRAHTSVDGPRPDLLPGQLLEGIDQGLEVPLRVRLDHEVQLADLALTRDGEELLQARGPRGHQIGCPGPGLPLLGEVTGVTLGGEDPEIVARIWDPAPSQQLNRIRRCCIGQRTAYQVTSGS